MRKGQKTVGGMDSTPPRPYRVNHCEMLAYPGFNIWAIMVHGEGNCWIISKYTILIFKNFTSHFVFICYIVGLRERLLSSIMIEG